MVPLQAAKKLGRSAEVYRTMAALVQPGLQEMAELERVLDDGGSKLQARVACEVRVGERRFPVHVVTLGNPSPEVPAVGFFGGLHGLERIGAEVVISFLCSLVRRLRWDSTLHRQLESVRLVFMPIVNPGGMWLGTPSNPNGVDLMRNSPLNARERVPFLVGGQRISPLLPWYRGGRDSPMEAENRAVCKVVAEELLGRRFSLAVDCHSGFGSEDRIRFPYAHTSEPIRHLPEMHALKEIFDQTHAAHGYIFEPRSRRCLAHGDLWDYLYLQACALPGRIFLPLTLEMGSWMWVKKNPRQFFSRQGIFHPALRHRRQRVLHCHVAWLDFLSRAACSPQRWLPVGCAREWHRKEALELWYGRDGP